MGGERGRAEDSDGARALLPWRCPLPQTCPTLSRKVSLYIMLAHDHRPLSPTYYRLHESQSHVTRRAVTCARFLDCRDMCCSRLSSLTCAVTCARFLDSTIEAARRETGRQRVLVLVATDRQAPLTDLIQSTSAMPHVTVIHTSAAHSVLQEFVNLTGARAPPPHA
jgi:hypothetical protein